MNRPLMSTILTSFLVYIWQWQAECVEDNMSPLYVCRKFLLLKLVFVCSLSGYVAGNNKIFVLHALLLY